LDRCKNIVWGKMSESHRAVRCRCANAIYAGGYEESDSDPDNDAPDTRGGTAEMRDVDARSSTDSTRIESSVMSRDPSQKSIAVEVLKNVDADRMSRINVQNLRLSLLFPEASLILSHVFPSLFFILSLYRNLRAINVRKFTSGQMFWGRTFESVEHLPTGSSFEIRFDLAEEEYARSLRFPRFIRQKVMILPLY